MTLRVTIQSLRSGRAQDPDLTRRDGAATACSGAADPSSLRESRRAAGLTEEKREERREQREGIREKKKRKEDEYDNIYEKREKEERRGERREGLEK